MGQAVKRDWSNFTADTHASVRDFPWPTSRSESRFEPDGSRHLAHPGVVAVGLTSHYAAPNGLQFPFRLRLMTSSAHLYG